MEDKRFQDPEPPLKMDVPTLRCTADDWLADIDKELDELERVFNELNELELIEALDQFASASNRRR